MVDERSDWDVCVVLADREAREAFDREFPYAHGARVEIVSATLEELRDLASEHGRYAAAHADVVLDKTGGELTRVVAEQESLPTGSRDAIVREALDGYVNQTYRSLRYGTRLDAVEAIPHALRTIFALADRVRPYNKYLEWELRHHPLEGLDRGRAPAAARPRAHGRAGGAARALQSDRAARAQRGLRRRHRRLGAGRRVAPRQRRLPRPVKKRLDVLLVERGLAESRAQAQALVLAGLVHGYDKPGHQVEDDAELAVESPPPYVSRGGEKLAHGLDGLGVDPAGLDCVDVGASTGGFTDVLLQRGATRVIALDVGYGQLHPRLRADPRVTVLERTNARTLTELPFAPQLAVCDVSFISVRLALPPVLRLCAPGWQAVVLVKPQFEAGRADVGKGGVVRDDEVRRRVVREVAEAAPSWGASVLGVVDSGLPGPKGNREIFLHLAHSEHPTLPDDLDERIEQALAG